MAVVIESVVIAMPATSTTIVADVFVLDCPMMRFGVAPIRHAAQRILRTIPDTWGSDKTLKMQTPDSLGDLTGPLSENSTSRPADLSDGPLFRLLVIFCPDHEPSGRLRRLFFHVSQHEIEVDVRVQRAGDLQQGLDPHVELTLLVLADVRAVDLRPAFEVRLREPSGFPRGTELLADGERVRGDVIFERLGHRRSRSLAAPLRKR